MHDRRRRTARAARGGIGTTDTNMSSDEEIRACVRKYIPQWAEVSDDLLKIAPVTGGLTNRLALCQNLLTGDRVIVRIFGCGTESYFSRADEQNVFQAMARHNIGPMLHGTWSAGRIEGFILGSSLQVDQLADPFISNSIASKMALLHMIPIASVDIAAAPQTFPRMRAWLAEAASVRFDAVTQRDKCAALEEMDLPSMPATLHRLETFLLELRSPVVLCHNDLQEGNVMWNGDPEQQVQLIDFEYCSSGYRGFDIGNHFCEWAVVNSCPESETGFEIRIEAYPDSAQRLNFARTYLASAACAAKLGNSNADGGSSDGASPIRSAGGGISFTDHEFAAALAAVDASDEATSLAHEAHCYELAAHLTWAIWGVCQASKSEIAFGFSEYALARFREFRRIAAEVGFQI